MFTKKTSLIIPTHNRPRFLGKTLKRLLALNLLFSEIIVVDSSNDKYKKKIKVLCKKYKAKLFESQASTSLQRNVGLKKRNKKNIFIMFLDDDVIFLKNSFFEMNETIKKYYDNSEVVAFGFNQIQAKNNNFLERFKKSDFVKRIKLYSDQPGFVTKGGWNTKILNVKNDTFANWVFTTASIFKSNSIKNKFFNLSFGEYSYLEDLDFSLNLTKSNKKIIISSLAKFKHPLNIDRSNFKFGNIEVVNRYKIVKKFNLSKIFFFINLSIRFFMSLFKIFLLDLNSFLRAMGNIYGLSTLLFIKAK
jgi:glycosyltransferase involved in cell wall biosynthesis